MNNCPVCGRDAKTTPPTGRTHHFKCLVCGEYSIHKTVENSLLDSGYQIKRYILSGVLREASENGNPITITNQNIQDILDSTSVSDSPFEAIDRILNYVYHQADNIASDVTIHPFKDYPIAYAKDSREFSYYLDKTIKLGYLDGSQGISGSTVLLTLEGWKRVGELRKKQIESSQAFVAMWFDKNMDKAWEEGFKEALKETGYNPIRVDLVEHNEKICDRIIAEIRKSGLLVADFTGNRGGVYFEAGFAKGLGVPVIWTCRKDHLDDVHFDTRQFNHIEWEKPEELKRKLIDRIEATLPNRVRKQAVG